MDGDERTIEVEADHQGRVATVIIPSLRTMTNDQVCVTMRALVETRMEWEAKGYTVRYQG